jgi:hypothetical protein
VTDELEQRVRLLELAQTVYDGRLNEFEAWRRRDEPRIAALALGAEVAAEVRKALDERSSHTWTLWQKIAAAVVGLPTFAGSVVALLQGLGVA